MQRNPVCKLAVEILCAVIVSTIIGAPVCAETALEHLQAAPKPHFREGHTLLPLTRWGWTMPFDVRVELADHWGYALEFGGYATPEYVAQLDDPESIPSRIVALTSSDPERYPLFVLTDRSFPDDLPEETWCHDAQGNRLEGPEWKLWSPEAPDSVFERAGELAVKPLKKIQEKAPIAILLNGGEYALTVYGHAKQYWEQDPTILAAKGDRSWFEYISERKAHQELIISNAIRAQCPDRKLYIYYWTSGCPQRNQSSRWWWWVWGYKWMRPVSDIPNSSIYFKQFNSGWTGENDMLTQALNAVAQCIALGDTLSYNWVCGGWLPGKFSDPQLYMGYLKCYYTAGMIGGVAGYFSYPKGGFDGDVGEKPPSWLEQMMVLGRVHALFSHLEEFLRDGDLLPGPNRHRWSKDLPAYEFPTGDPNQRVLVRKRRGRAEWLITAWTTSGAGKRVTVTIPELGTVRVRARRCGSVYRAVLQDGRPQLTLIDKDRMFPSAGL